MVGGTTGPLSCLSTSLPKAPAPTGLAVRRIRRSDGSYRQEDATLQDNWRGQARWGQFLGQDSLAGNQICHGDEGAMELVASTVALRRQDQAFESFEDGLARSER